MKLIELLSTESKWAQGAYARDSQGESVDARDSSAVAWCMLGAIDYCYRDLWAAEYVKDSLLALLHRQPIIDWQDKDERTYSDVRTVLTTLAEEGY